jgi:hypothetical protein
MEKAGGGMSDILYGGIGNVKVLLGPVGCVCWHVVVVVGVIFINCRGRRNPGRGRERGWRRSLDRLDVV